MTRLRLRSVLATGALALALALGFQVGGAFSSSDDTEQARKVAEAFRIISEAYVEDVDSAHLAESAIEGMLADLDPHSIYISADEMRAVRESFNATFDGIGIYYEWVEGEAEQDTLVVLMPIAGGPSEEAGLEAGDRIVQIDDTLALGFDTNLVQQYLKGPRGTEVDARASASRSLSRSRATGSHWRPSSRRTCWMTRPATSSFSGSLGRAIVRWSRPSATSASKAWSG